MPRSKSPSPGRSAALPTCVVLLAAVAGCGGDGGPPRAAVSGAVTAGGAPLAAGAVVFTPAAGGPRTSARVTDGAFALPAHAGPVVGEHRVTVTPAHPAAPEPDDERAARRLQTSPPARAPLPPPATFDAAVAPDGPNAFTFDLPAPRRR